MFNRLDLEIMVDTLLTRRAIVVVVEELDFPIELADTVFKRRFHLDQLGPTAFDLCLIGYLLVELFYLTHQPLDRYTMKVDGILVFGYL